MNYNRPEEGVIYNMRNIIGYKYNACIVCRWCNYYMARLFSMGTYGYGRELKIWTPKAERRVLVFVNTWATLNVPRERVYRLTVTWLIINV